MDYLEAFKEMENGNMIIRKPKCCDNKMLYRIKDGIIESRKIEDGTWYSSVCNINNFKESDYEIYDTYNLNFKEAINAIYDGKIVESRFSKLCYGMYNNKIHIITTNTTYDIGCFTSDEVFDKWKVVE